MAKVNRFFLTTMVGTRGRAVSALTPEGVVRIKGELWQAIAAGGPINPGEEVTLVEQEGLTLTVASSNPTDAEGMKG
jgi:membrane-bound serine protease (ClpP class)